MMINSRIFGMQYSGGSSLLMNKTEALIAVISRKLSVVFGSTGALSWQYLPVKSLVQRQLRLSPFLRQVPPLRHGSKRHASNFRHPDGVNTRPCMHLKPQNMHRKNITLPQSIFTRKRPGQEPLCRQASEDNASCHSRQLGWHYTLR